MRAGPAFLSALFLCVFALYLACAYPTVAPRDSADMAAAALTLGPAHPPGYPLYCLLGKAWITALPLGDPAYRLNVLSAVAGALAVVVFRGWLAEECGSGAAALGAGLCLAFSAPLWKFSLLSEMYSLQALFAAALLRLSSGDSAGARRRAAWSGLLFGLGLVNHQSLLFLAPALLWLWRGQGAGRFWREWLGLTAAGLALYGFVWIRLGSFSEALALITRKEYGSLSLFSGFSRPMTPALAQGLLRHLAEGLWTGTSGLTMGLALLGGWELWRKKRRLAAGLGLVFLFFGPVYFLMTRFDLSSWVARSVLETAFLIPVLAVCAAAAFGLARLGRRPAIAAVLALAAAGSVAWAQGENAFHRDDFSAWDYGNDLRRVLPPGSVTAAGGDTAHFVMSYLELTRPSGAPRRLLAFRDAQGAKVDYALGLSADALDQLGLKGRLQPEGLAQKVVAGAPDLSGAALPWNFSILRRGTALRREESYARDILLSYAFAHYLSGRIAESNGNQGAAMKHYISAAALDPEDYQLEVSKP